MNKAGFKKAMVLIIIIFFIKISSICIFAFSPLIKTSHSKETNDKDFLNIIFNLPPNWTIAKNWVEENLAIYKDSLYYNGIQIYNDNSSKYGEFKTTLNSSQINNFKNLMSEIHSYDLKGFYARTNITWLAEAQRIEYEISKTGSKTVNEGFCYLKVMANTYKVDNGRSVLNPVVGTNRAGWLCRNIYENIQHSDFVNKKDQDTWFIKPVMRIDKKRYCLNDTTTVVRIDIINFNGDMIKSVNIRVMNFGDSYFNYEGNYVHNYNFSNDPEFNLEVPGNTSKTGLNFMNKGNFDNSKIDFKIYWPGLVDVWFDKIILDDDLGNQLLGGKFDNIIKDEVTNFGIHPGNYTFYCDEIVYSQIPSVEYLKNKMKSFEPLSNISYVMSNIQNENSLRNDTVAYGSSLKRIKPKVFFTDPYLIPWEIPDNISFPGAQQLSLSKYNELMQKVFDSFIYQVSLGRKNVKNHSPEPTKFFVIPQLFGSMLKKPMGNFIKQGNREPTNQEIEVQAMLSIVHNAEGLGWFIYQGSEWKDEHSIDSGFVFGLINPDGSKRTANIYNQNKWEFVRDLNEKIMNWKPVLDNLKWINAYSVHNQGSQHEYISDLKSYDNSSEDLIKFWELGFFIPEFVDPNDKSKYFMLVNRRCVPNINDEGDQRKLTLKFNSSQLFDSEHWIISDVNLNEVVATFDINENKYIQMGIFQPGEGRLYKLTPIK